LSGVSLLCRSRGVQVGAADAGLADDGNLQSGALRRYAWSLLRNTAEANDLV
jgi:hypothetical protein